MRFMEDDLLSPQPLIQFNPHHQTDGYCEKADGAFDPVEGIFHDYQKHHSNQDERGHFVPDAQSVGFPVELSFT